MMKRNSMRFRVIPLLFVLVIPTLVTGPSLAQGDARLFPETGKTVKGRFWTAPF